MRIEPCNHLVSFKGFYGFFILIEKSNCQQYNIIGRRGGLTFYHNNYTVWMISGYMVGFFSSLETYTKRLFRNAGKPLLSKRASPLSTIMCLSFGQNGFLQKLQFKFVFIKMILQQNRINHASQILVFQWHWFNKIWYLLSNGTR